MKLQDFSNELRKDPYFVIAELQLKLEEANARIIELEAQTRWIPVGERLPEEEVKVLAYYDDGIEIATIDTMKDEKKWHDWEFMTLDYVTHWMPLPQPPEAQND